MSFRVFVWFAMMVAVSATARAQAPNHVRIIWDVERSISCGFVRPLADTSLFEVPAQFPCESQAPVGNTIERCTGAWCRTPIGIVAKGDYVTVYAFNYNAASYKALAPAITTVKPEEPVAITLLSAVLQAGGYKTFGVDRANILAEAGATAAGSPCAPLVPATCLTEIGGAVLNIDLTIAIWEKELRRPAREIAIARPAIPASLRDPAKPGAPEFGITGLTAFGCRFSVVETKSPLGDVCQQTRGWVQEIGLALGRAAALIRAFDSGYNPSLVTDDHVKQRDRYKRAVDGWVDYLTGNQSGVRSELAAGVAQLADDLSAVKAYRAALDRNQAGSYAVELPRQGPVAHLSRLVFSLPLRFTGDPDSAPAQITRTFTLEIAVERPPVLGSAGVIWLPRGTFDFKKLALEQVPAEGGALTRRMIAVDTQEFRDVSALLGTHVRLHRNSRVPYVTFGTTADRKIFRSALLGLSWFAPRWRSLITLGMVTAKGSSAGDIQAVIDRYSVNGIAPDSLNLAQVFPEEKWRWTFAAGWTLTPF